METLVEETYTATQIDDIIDGILYEFDEMATHLKTARTVGDYTQTDAVFNGILDLRNSIKRYKVKEKKEEVITLSLTES